MKYLRHLKTFSLLLVGLFLLSCSEGERVTHQSKLIDSIEMIVEHAKTENTDKKFNLTKLDLVEWNKLYIFGPYTPTINIEHKIGVISDLVKGIDIEARDDITLLILMKQDEVTGIVPYPRKKLDFSTAVSSDAIFRDKAIFSITENKDETEWYHANLSK